MDPRRQFNFENPEDSYWNDSSVTKSKNFTHHSSAASSSFFDDKEPEDESTFNIFGECETKDATPSDLFENVNSPKWTNLPTFNDVQSLSDKISVVNSQKEFDTREASRVLTGEMSLISDCCSIGSRSSELTVQLDYARLKSEHKKLLKHFENTRRERFKPLSAEDTVKRLLKSQPVSLDLYCTREEKELLLKAALNSFDYDVISTIVLFLKRTLNNAIFRAILIQHLHAADHYVQYLRESGNTQELIDTLFALGRNEDAAMVEFEEACRICEPRAQLNALEKCLVSGFSVPALDYEARFVREFIAILK